jgi:hypothetical protein
MVVHGVIIVKGNFQTFLHGSAWNYSCKGNFKPFFMVVHGMFIVRRKLLYNENLIYVLMCVRFIWLYLP